jgi:hypothetical protein
MRGSLGRPRLLGLDRAHAVATFVSQRQSVSSAGEAIRDPRDERGRRRGTLAR